VVYKSRSSDKRQTLTQSDADVRRCQSRHCGRCLIPVDDFELTRRLATKTPYYSQADAVERPPPPSCRPDHASMVVRHGTRYPTHKVLAKMAATTARLQALATASPA